MIGLGNSVVKRKLGGGPPAAPVNISQPFLIGTGEVGTVVTCNKGVWTGNPTPTYAYDFKVDGISVQISTSNTYTVNVSDDGKVITCEVTATNTQGFASATTSNSITVGTAPANTVAPTVTPSGTQSTGTVITVNVGTWTGTPTITYEYRWTRNGSPISLATNSTYTIQAADDGTTIRCEVRGTNAYGVSSYVASSNSVSAVNAVAPVNTVAPTISGSTTLGSTLTSTTGTWTGIPTPTYSYQWKRNGSNIGGATASTYVTTLADSSANITCDVTATNVAGSATAGSNTITLPSYAPVNTVAPVVSGTAVVGQALSTTNGTWTNSPSTFSYQWFRGATPIGTNSANYTLVQADAGNTSNIKCVVTATNSAGSASADSNTVAQVMDANANAYLSADTFSNTSMIAATNNLFISAKSKGYFSSLRVLYNWKNANSSLNKWNMLNPVDSDAAFRAGFFGSITHGSNGLVGTAANVYVRSYFNTSNLSLNSGTIGQYHASDATTATWICGCVSGSNRFDVGFDSPRQLFVAINTTGSDIVGAANRQGLLLGTRRASNVVTGKVNKTLVVNSARASMTNPNLEIYFMARNNGGTFQISLQNIPVPMAVISDGLTSQQEDDLTDDLNTFIAAW